jgi:hypothetical protein
MKNSSPDKIIKLYRRLMKYPPVATARKTGPMKIIHDLDNGGQVIAEATEYVTTDDLEKLLAVIYLVQDGREIKEVKHAGISVVITSVNISEIRGLTGSNDYPGIVTSLKRCTKLTITFKFAKEQVTTHLVHESKYNESTGEIAVALNGNFFRACKEKALNLNFGIYSKLSPTERNLYSFLSSNPAPKFTEDLLLQRAVITASAKFKARQILKHSLSGIVSKQIIAGFKVLAGTIYKIERVEVPQQV